MTIGLPAQLLPGQLLSIRWRDGSDIIKQNLVKMRLSVEGNGNPYAHGVVALQDSSGVSIFINRGYNHGGDMKAFLKADDVMWSAYFEKIDGIDKSIGDVRQHYTTPFPLGFLPKA